MLVRRKGVHSDGRLGRAPELAMLESSIVVRGRHESPLMVVVVDHFVLMAYKSSSVEPVNATVELPMVVRGRRESPLMFVVVHYVLVESEVSSAKTGDWFFLQSESAPSLLYLTRQQRNCSGRLDEGFEEEKRRG